MFLTLAYQDFYIFYYVTAVYVNLNVHVPICKSTSYNSKKPAYLHCPLLNTLLQCLCGTLFADAHIRYVTS